MKKNHVLYGIFVFLLFACTPRPKQVILIQQGQSDYTIIIPEDADTLVSRAAKELQSFLEQSTQAKLSVRPGSIQTNIPAIFVGFGTTQALEKESIFYYVEGQQLFISGGSPRSTLYAVYNFLEQQLGLRFFSPEVTELPPNTRLTLPAAFSYSYTPPVKVRTVHARLFYDDLAFADRLKVTHEGFPGYVPEARVHTFHRFLPAAQYYDEHPEYYALRNGRRLSTQLCLSHPEVLRIVREKVSDLFTRYPDHNIISVSQDDNTQYCQCEDCRAIDEKEESPAGTMIHFVNQVARAFPDKTISTLAYQYTRKAPKTVQPEPNVLITLCSIECDRSAPIADKCPDFARDLEEWGALTDNIRIWDYTTQFTNFLAPFPNIETLGPNIQLFVDNNAKWIFEQHSHAPSELFELRAYLTAKLLWNPALDPKVIMDEFLSGYYQEAAPLVAKYVQTVHDELKRDSSFFLFLYGDPAQGFDSFLSAENLKQYNDWYDEAVAAVADSPELLRRVKTARLSVDYASLEAARKSLSPEFSIKNNPTATEKRLQAFRQTTQGAGITAMNEMRYSVAEYLNAYQHSLERSKIDNLAYQKTVTLLQAPKKYANENPQTLTDGALGGSSFYANWLGFEGNDLEAVIDLKEVKTFDQLSTTFLQVVNHIVFFPESVRFSISTDGENFTTLGELDNQRPLRPESKINDLQTFTLEKVDTRARYIKVTARNRRTAPDWHHGAGLPSWIFIDEVIVSKN